MMDRLESGQDVTSSRGTLGGAISILALYGVVIWQFWTLVAGPTDRLVLAVVAREPLQSRRQITAADVSLSFARVSPNLDWFDDPEEVIGRFVAAPGGSPGEIGAAQPIYSTNVTARMPLPDPAGGVIATVAATPSTASIPPADFRPEDRVDLWVRPMPRNGSPAPPANVPPAEPVLAASGVRVVGVAAESASDRRLYLLLTGQDPADTARRLLSGSVLVVRR